MNLHPLVSIGLPVYNGENYIAEAIQSVLDQTYTNFELIISDNSSTDKTPVICEHYADIDSRIRYYRSSENRGAAWNFNNTFYLATGKYFKWLAHDDLITPRFIEFAVDILETKPEIVLCTSLFLIRNGSNHDDTPYDVVFAHAEHNNPFVRFRETFDVKHRCFDVFGLYRKSELNKTPLIQDYIGSDRVLISIISLIGKTYIMDGYYCINREHNKRSIRINDPQKLINWYNTQKSGRTYRNFTYYRKLFLSCLRYAKTVPQKTRSSLYVLFKAILNYKEFYRELYYYHSSVQKFHNVYQIIKKIKPHKYESITDGRQGVHRDDSGSYVNRTGL